jgi:hypothetical protein
LRWAELYGCAPTSYDWSRTHARQRGAQALRRLERDEWPSPATVSKLYGTWAAALRVTFDRPGSSTSVPMERSDDLARATPERSFVTTDELLPALT